MVLLAVISLVCHACTKNLTSTTIAYFNDFENRDTSGIRVSDAVAKIDSITISKYNGSNVFGRFNGNLIFLDVANPPSHNAVRVEFDLYIHDNWVGNDTLPGVSLPEFWTFLINNQRIYLSTFSNGSQKQTFPDDYTATAPKNAARANAWAALPGVCSRAGQPDGTTLYKIDYTTTHSGNIQLVFADLPLKIANTTCQKSWSLDNLRVSTIMYK